MQVSYDALIHEYNKYTLVELHAILGYTQSMAVAMKAQRAADLPLWQVRLGLVKSAIFYKKAADNRK